MEQLQKQPSTILIADDSEMNRAILADMLGSEYTIVEAENGREALEQIQILGPKLILPVQTFNVSLPAFRHARIRILPA